VVYPRLQILPRQGTDHSLAVCTDEGPELLDDHLEALLRVHTIVPHAWRHISGTAEDPLMNQHVRTSSYKSI
jgi:hypothetical protein